MSSPQRKRLSSYCQSVPSSYTSSRDWVRKKRQKKCILRSKSESKLNNPYAAEHTTDRQSISDLSTRKIAQSNLLISSSLPSNPFLAHKIFNSTPVIPDNDKLFSFQSRPLTANSKSLDLQAFKYDGVAVSTALALARHHSPTISPDINSLSVLNAAAHARNEAGNAALKKVLTELEKRPNDVGLIATVVQMYILANNTTQAITLLESFFKRLDDSISENEKDVRFSPGLIGIMVALYRSQGRKSHVKQELARAASYWRHKSKTSKPLLQAAGVALLDSSNPEDISSAGDIFTKLREQDRNDKIAIAGYISSYAAHSPEKVEPEVDKLTPMSALIAGIDIDALENAGIPQSSNALAIAQHATSRKRAAAEDVPSRPKRIRKSRLPKDFEPGKTPDPERWLPLRDRSSYRPKGKKKGKKDGGDRTQGGIVADDVGVKEAAPVKGPAGGPGNKKRKGKGKR